MRKLVRRGRLARELLKGAKPIFQVHSPSPFQAEGDKELNKQPQNGSRQQEEVDAILSPAKTLLRRYGLHPRKKLGQHFLVNRKVLQQILDAAELAVEDVVVEVGPGLGILTQELAKRVKRVFAIELDDNLAAVLKADLAVLGNITIINGNALDINPATLLAEYGTCPDYKVVANIPYYITSPLLRHFLEAQPKPKRMVVMVQKEVAQAIVAPPGKMSLLSVSVQFYGRPKIVDYVPARSFYPPPEVDSTILRIDIYDKPVVEVGDIAGFFRLVDAAFSAPRKQLHNSLAQGLDLRTEQVLSLLGKANIDAKRRAQALTLEEWARLWAVVAGGM